MAAYHMEQLVLGLEWSREEVRASLVLLVTEQAPTPIETRVALRRAA
jgi:hypothetical protein